MSLPKLRMATTYLMTIVAAVIVVGYVGAVAAGVYSDEGASAGPVLRLAVLAAAAISCISLVSATVGFLRGEGTSGVMYASALVFIAALAVALSMNLPQSNPFHLINYPG